MSDSLVNDALAWAESDGSDTALRRRLESAGKWGGAGDNALEIVAAALRECRRERNEWKTKAILHGNAALELEEDLRKAITERDEAMKELAATVNQSLTIDLDAMLEACIPGGTTCDSQEVADAIREWFADHIVDANKKVPDADGWIPHCPGDPMPCDGCLMVWVKLMDSQYTDPFPSRADYWRSRHETGDHWRSKNSPTAIIAWKPAE